MMQWARKQTGFTIVEILVVIVVIAILATITTVSYNGISNRAKDAALAASINQIATKITSWTVLNGNKLPADRAVLASDLNIVDNGTTTYQYTVNTTVTPNLFCITVSMGDKNIHAAGDASGGMKKGVAGPCNGHAGTAPTTLADGSSCPTGYVVVPGNSLFGTNAFCVMKYEAKNVGGVATSQAAGEPWSTISHTDALSAATNACAGCHLITENEWMTIAHNVFNVSTNWTGGSVGSGSLYIGHSDGTPFDPLAASTNDSDGYSGTNNGAGSNQRRTMTLSNGQVIWDLSGNVWEWTQGTVAGGKQPGINGETSYGYKDWNNAAIVWADASDYIRPSYGSPAASSMLLSQGIGQFTSNYGETTSRVIGRGASWGHGSGASIFTVSYAATDTATARSRGFRVAF